jgi:hypothetical protein
MASFDSVRFISGRPLLGEVTADKLNAILREIRKNRPRGERGITVRESGDATYIGLATAIKQSGAPAQDFPWEIYVTDSEEESYTVKVRPGTVGGILPSNWDDQFTCEKDQLYFGKVNLVTDGKNITSATIVIDAEEPATQEVEEFAVAAEVDVLFGLFKNEGFRIATSGNISAYPQLALTTSKSPPAEPGESPYVFWYRLS